MQRQAEEDLDQSGQVASAKSADEHDDMSLSSAERY